MAIQVEKKINETTVIKAQGSTLLMAYEQLVNAQEVFGSTVCGACGGVARLAKFKDTCKAICQKKECGASLLFVTTQDGHMFPARTNKDKSLKANNGWEVYKRQADSYVSDGYQEPASRQVNRDEDIPF